MRSFVAARREGVPARACQTDEMALESRRWFNPSQPQTLQIAVWLLYFNAVGGLIFGSVYVTLGVFLGLIALVGCGAAAFGIANEQRWGYLLGVAMSLLQVLLIVGVVGILGLFKGGPHLVPLRRGPRRPP